MDLKYKFWKKKLFEIVKIESKITKDMVWNKFVWDNFTLFSLLVWKMLIETGKEFKSKFSLKNIIHTILK